MSESLTLNRLRKILICNKDLPSAAIQKIIKSDIIKVLEEYATIIEDSVSVCFNLEKNGGYNFCIKGKVSHIKDIGLHIN